MSKEHATELEVENQAVTENTPNDDIQTDEGTQGADVGKQEGSQNKYEEELRKLKEEDAKNKELIKNKNIAIAALKKENKGITDEELDKRLDQRLADREFKSKLEAVSSDKSERELIQRFYDTEVVKTGDVDKDLRKAIALANADLVVQARQQQAEQEQREDRQVSTSFSSERSYMQPQPTLVEKEASAILGNLKLNPEQLKKAQEALKKYIS